MRKPTVISVGLVVAAEPDTDPANVDWKPVFEEMGFRVCGQIQVRRMDARYDAPNVILMHEDDPLSFDPKTQFVSLTAPVLWKGTMAPFYNGTPEVTALLVDESQSFQRPRTIVDAQDQQKGLLWTPGSD